MANIFAILTAIVLAVATFIAFQNKGRPDEEGRGYAGWITKRENMERALKRKQEHLAGVRKDLADTESELVDYNGKNEILDGQVTAQKEKNTELAAKVEAKEAEAQAKATEVASKKESIEEFGDVDQVLAQLTQLQRDLAQIELDIAQREAQEASLEAQRTGVDRSLADVRKRINWRVSGSSNPELRTSVRSVYATLGFVTMTGGDNLGIVKNSTLEVVRDGEVVGKLLVTTVESHSAAADIIPGSVVQGDSVRVGDSVRAPQVASPEPSPVAPAANPGPAPAPAPAGDPEPKPAPSTDPFG